MHPTFQNSSPQPSIPCSTSMPHLNPKSLSIDLIHHELIPKFLQPNESIAGNLSWTARNSEPSAVLSDLWFQKPNPIYSQILSLNHPPNPHIVWGKNFKFNSPPQSFRIIPWHTVTCPIIPLFFQWQDWMHLPQFPHFEFPDPFFFQQPLTLLLLLLSLLHWNLIITHILGSIRNRCYIRIVL